MAFIDCPLPQGKEIPEVVSLSAEQCGPFTNALVVNRLGIKERAPQRRADRSTTFVI